MIAAGALALLALVGWMIWDCEQTKRHNIARRYQATFASAGLRFSSCTSSRVFLDVVEPVRFAAANDAPVARACAQVLGGDVTLAAGGGVVVATRKQA